MSADVENNSSTTTSRWTTNSTRTRSRISSLSAELLPPNFRSTTPMSSSPTTASTPLLPSPLLPIPLSSSPSPSPPPTMSSVPSTTTPTTTTTTTTTITPTSTITTTTSISISIPLSPTPTLPPISSSSTPPASSSSSTPPTSTTPIRPVTSPSFTGIPTPEMLSSPRTIGPVSTFSTTVYIQTTDSRGSSMSYAPSFITSTTHMDMGGTPTTSTAIIANPTLNTDTSSPSSFFHNKGAVAGVFTLVGIAVISIAIWIILFIRRRRRELGLEQESTISALLYEGGFDRRSIEPASSASSHHSRYDSAEFLAIPMPNSNPERHRRSTSGLLERRLSIMPDAYQDDRGQYDPFIQYAPRNSRDGYPDVPSPTTPHLNVPPPSAYAPYRDRTSNDGVGMVEVGPGLPMGAAIVHTRYSHHNSRTNFEPWKSGPLIVPGQTPLVLDPTNLSNGRASQTPSTDTSSASTSKPSYLPSLSHPNFYATNTSSRSGLLINGREDHGSEVNMVEVNGEIKIPDILAESESTTEDEHEMESQKRVLAVRNLTDTASTLSHS